MQDLDFKNRLFENREEATEKLLEVLPLTQMKDEKWFLLAISAEAVPMVEMVAKKLNLNYDVLFTEPIATPNNSKCDIAMISETEELVINEELREAFNIKIEYIYGESHRKYEEKILKYIYKYRKGASISPLEGKQVMLVDEGCESGMTVMTAIKTVMKEKASSVVFATPMIPANVEKELESVTDQFYTLHHIANFVDVDFYYEDKSTLTTEEVQKILEESKHYLPLQKEQIQKIKTGENEE